MSLEELLGVGVVLGTVTVIGAVVASSRLSPFMKNLVYLALVLRVVGASLRYFVLFRFYGGTGDARRYYATGLEYASRFGEFDFSPFMDSTLWLRSQWWGTSFVPFPTGLTLAAVGPSMLGAFAVFSLMAFLGLLGFVLAFRRAYPDAPVHRYAVWVWLFPSLWFWPSSIGKEAIVMMGLGLAVAGFVGTGRRLQWSFLILGTGLVFAIRPQVAAVLLLSFVLGHWLSLGRSWTTRSVLQSLVILGTGLGGIWLSMTHIGVGGFDVEGVQSYLESESAGAASTGSTIEDVQVRLSGIPMALVNILMRPFPWEATNAMALLSGLEIAAMWAICWYRRHNLLRALQSWRSDRFIAMSLAFILIYAITLGMLIVNLGIIARQRVFLFPLLFLLLEAKPRTRPRRRALPSARVTGLRHPHPSAAKYVS